MTILLLGADGQVGWELRRALAPLGDVVALTRDAAANLDGLAGDLEDLSGLRATIDTVAPAWIVNAAAYTMVDKAESDQARAAAINALAPAFLAEHAARTGAWLVHYSTDYVFDGNGVTPWREGDSTGPAGVYGRTKLAGEESIRASGCSHLILRTSWVHAARGHNFPKTILRLAKERSRLEVVSDQVGAPTGADLIADVTAQAMSRTADTHAGIYHLAASGETDWASYAKFVIAAARARGAETLAKPEDVRGIATGDYHTAAPRPLNSRLDTAKLRNTFGLTLPDWRVGVSRMIAEHVARA